MSLLTVRRTDLVAIPLDSPARYGRTVAILVWPKEAYREASGPPAAPLVTIVSALPIVLLTAL